LTGEAIVPVVSPEITKGFYLTLVGLTLFVVALLVTLLVNVPIDGQIAK
jgi:hypothetical protein